MKKLFIKTGISLFLFFCFGNVFAQQLSYRVVAKSISELSPNELFSLYESKEHEVGSMTINYKPNGYEAIINGEKTVLEITNNRAVVTTGKIIITMVLEGKYYHDNVGYWRSSSIMTSLGDVGVAKMLYTGKTFGGRLYREELWLNGDLFNQSETVIDNDDHVVWSVMNSKEGVLRVTRK